MSKFKNLTLLSSEKLSKRVYHGHIFSGNGKVLAYLDNEYQLWIVEINPELKTSRIRKTSIKLEVPDKDSNVCFQSFDYAGKYICIDIKGDKMACFNLLSEQEIIRPPRNSSSAISPIGNFFVQLNKMNPNYDLIAKAMDLQIADLEPMDAHYVEFPLKALRYSKEELQQKFEGEIKKRATQKLEGEQSAEELAKKALFGKESSVLYELRLKLETRKQQKLLQNTLKYHSQFSLTKESLQENVYLDQPDSIYLTPIDDNSFEMFVGCYGFVWRTIVTVDDNGQLSANQDSGQFYSDVVYDPVEMLPSPSNEFTFARHGYGCSVLAIHSKTNSSWSFPTHEVITKYGYNSVFGITGGINTRKCIVSTKEGEFFWIPGETPIPLRGGDGRTIAIYENNVLSISSSKEQLNWYSFTSD